MKSFSWLCVGLLVFCVAEGEAQNFKMGDPVLKMGQLSSSPSFDENTLGVRMKKEAAAAHASNAAAVPVGTHYQPTPQEAQTYFEQAVNLCAKLSPSDQEFYAQVLNYKKQTDGLPDITDVKTMRAYLAVYKLVKYYPREVPSDNFANIFTEKFPLLGIWAREFQELEQKFGENPAYLWINQVLYNSDRFFMLSLDDKEKIDQLSEKWLYDMLVGRLNLPKPWVDKFLLDAINMGFRMRTLRSHVLVDDWDDVSHDWHVRVVLTPSVESPEKRKYMSVYLSAWHELMHVFNIFPGDSNSNGKEAHLMELPNSIYDIILKDRIYKIINGIDLMTEVNYSDVCGPVNYGKLAVFFWEMLEKYPHTNINILLTKPEVTQYFEQLYKDALR